MAAEKKQGFLRAYGSVLVGIAGLAIIAGLLGACTPTTKSGSVVRPDGDTRPMEQNYEKVTVTPEAKKAAEEALENHQPLSGPSKITLDGVTMTFIPGPRSDGATSKIDLENMTVYYDETGISQGNLSRRAVDMVLKAFSTYRWLEEINTEAREEGKDFSYSYVNNPEWKYKLDATCGSINARAAILRAANWPGYGDLRASNYCPAKLLKVPSERPTLEGHY